MATYLFVWLSLLFEDVFLTTRQKGSSKNYYFYLNGQFKHEVSLGKIVTVKTLVQNMS
jgi:hypothetical protein